ncbi:MAG: endonuclease III [Spirochaetaceae bacterium]|jgi:endonuclease-3|nr:endonuclease III [Spirochaetaceae bacterium]
MREPAQPDWDSILGKLQSWRNGLEPEGGQEPSVTAVAERYRRDPWAVLASTIVSLRTKDEVTLEVSRNLLKSAPSPERARALPEEAIARLLYPAGFYRTKAANLKKIALILTEQYSGQVPADMDALLALPGVGRKTANLVLIEAFDLDGICVDTHVHRIANRAGWVASSSPEQTEFALRELLPRKYWKGVNALLVLYGQRVCRPLSPFCSRCAISAHCARTEVKKSR